jgi:hypothetical protein
VSAVSAEIVAGTLPVKRFMPNSLRHNVLRSARASRPRDRMGGGGAYSRTSLVSAVMLAGNGPMKPFLCKDLIMHSEACGRIGMSCPRAAARSRSKACAALAGARQFVGAHRAVSAVSAEIVAGTLPEKRFSLRPLRRSVPVRHARVGRETARAAARRTGRPAG